MSERDFSDSVERQLGTRRWENQRVGWPLRNPDPPKRFEPPPVAQFIDAEIEGVAAAAVRIAAQDIAIDDLRDQLATERARAERAEARSRELEARLQAIREVVR